MVLSDITNAHSPKPSPAGKSAAPPTAYLCPISFEVMADPVSTADGHTFERAAIATWLAGHATSPLTGLPLANKTLTPNHAVRALAEAFVGKA